MLTARSLEGEKEAAGQQGFQLHDVTLCCNLICMLCSATIGYQIKSKGEQRQDCNMFEDNVKNNSKTVESAALNKALYAFAMLKTENTVAVFKDLQVPAMYNKTIVNIARKDKGKMVKNAKNQQKQEAQQGKRKLEEAKTQKNMEKIGEMIGKGDEDAGNMIKTENMIAMFENLHTSAV